MRYVEQIWSSRNQGRCLAILNSCRMRINHIVYEQTYIKVQAQLGRLLPSR